MTLLTITLVTLDLRGAGIVDSIRSVTRTVVGPIRSGGDVVLSPVGNVWNGIVGYDDLEAENERLRAQISVLAEQEARARSDSAAYTDLLDETGVQAFGTERSVTARVASQPFSNFDRTLELDRGSADGIKHGMPVTSAGGLVGRIVEVARNRSTVQLLTDPAMTVGVRLVRARDVALVQGGGDGSPLSITDGLEPSTEVLQGDLVETSGLDRSPYPRALPVGVVTEVMPGGVGPPTVEVEPLVDLARLDFVSVLIYEAQR